MSTIDVRGLDRPELAPLWNAARRRMERSSLEFGRTPLVLRNLSVVEREAIGGFLGLRHAGREVLRVDMRRLDEQLARSGRRGLREVLVALDGELHDRSGDRRTARARREEQWARAMRHPAIRRHPGLEPWLESLRRAGRLTRLDVEDPFDLLTRVLDLMTMLPVEPVSLAVLASRFSDDPHDLDRVRPAGALLTDALRSVTGLPERRAAWAAMGVEVDSVSSSALTLGLRGHPVLDVAADLGEPVRIMWRMLAGDSFVASAGDVWVCENPLVLDAAAMRLGAACPPLVCSDGMPNAVVRRLLGSLHDAGARVHVHADFDVTGMRIAASLLSTLEATPWRLSAADYVEALSVRTIAIRGAVPVTPWDPELGAAMRNHRRAVHEEAIIDPLLADLT